MELLAWYYSLFHGLLQTNHTCYMATFNETSLVPLTSMAFDASVLHGTCTVDSLVKWPLSVLLMLFYIVTLIVPAGGCCELTVHTYTTVHVA